MIAIRQRIEIYFIWLAVARAVLCNIFLICICYDFLCRYIKYDLYVGRLHADSRELAVLNVGDLTSMLASYQRNSEHRFGLPRPRKF